MSDDGSSLQEGQSEQDASLARLQAGGIPLSAERRLRELQQGEGAFTSDLSVADFALCHRLGVKPLSQVMGMLDLPGRLSAHRRNLGHGR